MIENKKAMQNEKKKQKEDNGYIYVTKTHRPKSNFVFLVHESIQPKFSPNVSNDIKSSLLITRANFFQ